MQACFVFCACGLFCDQGCNFANALEVLPNLLKSTKGVKLKATGTDGEGVT